jgi:hypothetical protein
VVSLGEVATAAAAAACDKASGCKDALGVAGDLAEDAHAILGSALEGDTTGDRDKVLARLQEVIDGVRDLWKALGKGMDHAQAALDAIQGTGVAPPTAPPAAHPSQVAPVGWPGCEPPPPLPLEKVEELRRELPPPVVSGTGRKTHGRWITPTTRRCGT